MKFTISPPQSSIEPMRKDVIAYTGPRIVMATSDANVITRRDQDWRRFTVLDFSRLR